MTSNLRSIQLSNGGNLRPGDKVLVISLGSRGRNQWIKDGPVAATVSDTDEQSFTRRGHVVYVQFCRGVRRVTPNWMDIEGTSIAAYEVIDMSNEEAMSLLERIGWDAYRAGIVELTKEDGAWMS